MARIASKHLLGAFAFGAWESHSMIHDASAALKLTLARNMAVLYFNKLLKFAEGMLDDFQSDRSAFPQRKFLANNL